MISKNQDEILLIGCRFIVTMVRMSRIQTFKMLIIYSQKTKKSCMKLISGTQNILHCSRLQQNLELSKI